MLAKNLTKNEMKRFSISYCPICGKNMKTGDYQITDFYLLKIRAGRSMAYRFIHTACLLSLGKEERADA